jgi:oligoendopeptidase F
MKLFKNFLVSVIVLSLITGSILQSQERDRSKVADQYKWNLTDIYSSDEAWQQAKERFSQEFPKVENYKGTLGKSPQELLKCMEAVDNLNKEFSKLAVYANLASDRDTRESKYLGMRQEIGQVGASYGAAVSFLQPEILKMDKATIDSFLKSEKKLEMYKHQLDDLLRTKSHTGTEGEEKINADAGLVTGAASIIYVVFTDAEFPY